jgi:hypothetical protein
MAAENPAPKPKPTGPAAKPAPPGAPAAHLKTGAPAPAPAAAKPVSQADRKPVIVGMAAGGTPTEEKVAAEAKKLLESTKSALGGLFAKAQAKLAEIQHKDQPKEVAPAAPAEGEAAAVAEPVPVPVVAKPAMHAKPVGMDRLVITVAEGTGDKAKVILVRKGIKDGKVEGDRLEFRYPSNRVNQVMKAFLDAHVEIYKLERTTEPAPAGGAPASPPPAEEAAPG